MVSSSTLRGASDASAGAAVLAVAGAPLAAALAEPATSGAEDDAAGAGAAFSLQAVRAPLARAQQVKQVRATDTRPCRPGRRRWWFDD